jgi:hypothetical protein
MIRSLDGKSSDEMKNFSGVVHNIKSPPNEVDAIAVV